MTLRSLFFAGVVTIATSFPVAALAATADTTPVPFDDTHATTYKVVAAPLTDPSAPADEYFGKFKLSNLGIRNIIHDITIEGNSPLALPHQVTRISGAESALGDWASKYPRDLWLPGTIVKLATLLQSKQQPLYDEAAVSLYYLLLEHYPNTWFSKFAWRQLQAFQEHPDFDMLTAPDVNDVANVIDYAYPSPR